MMKIKLVVNKAKEITGKNIFRDLGACILLLSFYLFTVWFIVVEADSTYKIVSGMPIFIFVRIAILLVYGYVGINAICNMFKWYYNNAN